jgi:hypothetical protein
MTLPRGGFWPVRHLVGGAEFQTQRIKKDVGGQDASLIYVGDPVRLVSGKAIRLVAGDTSATGPGIFGVVARIGRDEAGRPRVHGLPDQHPNISLTADDDWLDVYTDPNIVFAARCATSAVAELIGAGLNVATTARVTAAGISGAQLNVTAVSANTAPFKGVAIANFDLDGGGFDASGRIEVVMNYQTFKGAGTAPSA